MALVDRTLIVNHLRKVFPELVGMESAQVQAFLNEKTGLNVLDGESNGTAFDSWRKALAKDFPELWPYTQEQILKIQEKTEALLHEGKSWPAST